MGRCFRQRPRYYLTTRILTELFNQRDDDGEAVLEELSDVDASYLADVLPALSERQSGDQVNAPRRRGIFTSLTKLFIALLGERPLVLSIDDLQFVDEASLHLLRVLLLRGDLNVLVCGATTESLRLSGEEDAVPLERFLAVHEKDLGIRKISLDPLSGDDIAGYLHDVFPGLRMPKGFEQDLAELTQGNPLFLAEVIRKLVADQKVLLSGKDWVIEEIEEGYLPRSLEDIVGEQIAALDEEGRALLEQASMFGEDISLSMLTGSSKGDETKVLDFLDRAEALGLVKLSFQLNDETMRFLGKRILEISYGNISGDRRESMHERVGSYQESLYEQKILPSASLLAYHFKRSANQEKAQQYERIQVSYSDAVFDAREAELYMGDETDEDPDHEESLAAESLAHLPAFFRAIVTAVRNTRLYPAESAAIVQSRSHVKAALDRILEHNEHFHLAQSRRILLANGQRLDISEFRNPAAAFLKLLTSTDLQDIIFSRGLERHEIDVVLDALSDSSETVERGFWKRFAEQNGLEHVDLRQVRYSEVRRAKQKGAQGALPAEEEDLDSEDLAAIPRLLRAFRGGTNNIKLYPLESAQVSESIGEVHAALDEILQRRRLLNLSITEQSLLANGVRLTTTSFESLAMDFIDFMESSGLESITFLASLKTTELKAFFGALRELPGGADRQFWDQFTKEQQLTGVFFNQRQYSLGIVQSLLATELGIEDEDVDASAVAAWAEQIEHDPDDALRQALPRFGRDLLVQGETQLLRQLLRRLFKDFGEADADSRLQTAQAVSGLVAGLILALQHKFSKIAIDPLISAIRDSVEPAVINELTLVLNLLAGTALQFSDYNDASRVFMALRDRQGELAADDDKKAQRAAKLIAPRLDPAVQTLLEDDLKSGERDRQQNSAQILESLGAPSIPLLIEVIKQEKDFRTRQMAAILLASMGPKAADEIKRALNVGVAVEQRFRILEVIDIVTHELRDELAYSLGDNNAKIRRAAFRLADRLHDDALIEILLPFAASEDPNVIKGTILSLAHLGSASAVEAIAESLDNAKEPELAIACCQALGQVGDPAGVDGLKRVLARRKFASSDTPGTTRYGRRRRSRCARSGVHRPRRRCWLSSTTATSEFASCRSRPPRASRRTALPSPPDPARRSS